MTKKYEIKKTSYEVPPWDRTEIITITITILFLFSILGYAALSYYRSMPFVMTFTVKKSMVHIQYLYYTQVVTTDGIMFYLYNHPALEVGKNYTLEVVRHRELFNGGLVYDVVGGDG